MKDSNIEKNSFFKKQIKLKSKTISCAYAMYSLKMKEMSLI